MFHFLAADPFPEKSPILLLVGYANWLRYAKVFPRDLEETGCPYIRYEMTWSYDHVKSCGALRTVEHKFALWHPFGSLTPDSCSSSVRHWGLIFLTPGQLWHQTFCKVHGSHGCFGKPCGRQDHPVFGCCGVACRRCEEAGLLCSRVFGRTRRLEMVFSPGGWVLATSWPLRFQRKFRPAFGNILHCCFLHKLTP